MFIQTETMPNPATLKFLPGCPVVEKGTAAFTDANDARRSPLATALFGIEGGYSRFLGSHFITVTKSDDKEWDIMKTRILGTIMKHFLSGQLCDQRDPPRRRTLWNRVVNSIGAQIKDLIDTRIRQRRPRTVATSLSAALKDGWPTWNSTGPRPAS